VRILAGPPRTLDVGKSCCLLFYTRFQGRLFCVSLVLQLLNLRRAVSAMAALSASENVVVAVLPGVAYLADVDGGAFAVGAQ
jgi:hypothetical protein